MARGRALLPRRVRRAPCPPHTRPTIRLPTRSSFLPPPPGVARSAIRPVRASLDLYRKILERIEANGYDNFRKRAYVSKLEKFLQLPSSYMKCRQAAQEAARNPASLR